MLPDNTDASRDLGIVYSWRSLFLAQRASIDSALALHERGMKIAEDLAAADPSDVLQQADLATGHMEVGTILVSGARYRKAEEQFGEAYQRFARLAAHDTSNAETRIFMARSSRKAGEACKSMASRSATREERGHWRSRALEWFQKSLAIYRSLGKAGALGGEEIGAPDKLAGEVVALQAPPG